MSGALPARTHAATGAEPGHRREISGGVSIIPTADEEETVSVIAAIARREQQARGGAPQPHGKKTHRTLKEQQERLVSSISGVGNAVAMNLLHHFGSVERVFAASEEELKEVELVRLAPRSPPAHGGPRAADRGPHLGQRRPGGRIPRGPGRWVADSRPAGPSAPPGYIEID